MQPHQQRVVDETTELNEKLTKLRSFFNNPIFRDLDQLEKERLSRQETVMTEYAKILSERIDAFPK